MSYFVNYSFNQSVAQIQLLFGLKAPTLINYSSIIFWYMAIPGVIAGVVCRKYFSLSVVIQSCAALLTIGA
jgi:hypothetical protein